MTPQEVREFYKTYDSFTRLTGLCSANLYKWIKKGYVPKPSQYRLQIVSDGKLTIGEPFKSTGD